MKALGSITLALALTAGFAGSAAAQWIPPGDGGDPDDWGGGAGGWDGGAGGWGGWGGDDVPCQPGEFVVNGVCLACPAGRFSDTEDAEACTICPAGTYSAGGADSCTACPAGSLTPPGSSSCAPVYPVTISNLDDGEVLRHDLALIEGHVPAPVAVVVVDGAGVSRTWQTTHIGGGRYGFKALVDLAEGANPIWIHSAADAGGTVLDLVYQPQTNPRMVRLAYVMREGADGDFPGAGPNGVQAAVERIRFSGRLMQLAAAEMMYQQLGERRTFRLPRDENGEVQVEVIWDAPVDQSTTAILRDHFECTTGPAPADTCENQFTMCNRGPHAGSLFLAWKDTDHWAGGGAGTSGSVGNLMLAVTPDSIDSLRARFADFDAAPDHCPGWMSSSAMCAATGSMVMLHELGHVLGLPHAPDGDRHVMAKGAYTANRFFMMTEPGLGYVGESSPANPLMPAWHPTSAHQLAEHRHFDMDDLAYANETCPRVEVQPSPCAGTAPEVHVHGEGAPLESVFLSGVHGYGEPLGTALVVPGEAAPSFTIDVDALIDLVGERFDTAVLRGSDREGNLIGPTHGHKVGLNRAKRTGANGNTAWQSSKLWTTDDEGRTFGAGPHRAIKGDYKRTLASRHVSATLVQFQPAHQTDMQQRQYVRRVNVVVADDVGRDSMTDFVVLVSDSPMEKVAGNLESLMADPAVDAWSVHCPPPATACSVDVGRTARYVRVQLPGSGQLGLAEVRALGYAIP